MRGGKSAVRVSGAGRAGSREGLGALPGGPTAGKEVLLLGAGTIMPLFAVVGRTVAWSGGCRGEGCQVAGRAAAMPCPAQSCGRHRAKEREKTSELKSSFERNSAGKCAKTGTGAVLKSRAMFHLISIVRGESRKC